MKISILIFGLVVLVNLDLMAQANCPVTQGTIACDPNPTETGNLTVMTPNNTLVYGLNYRALIDCEILSYNNVVNGFNGAVTPLISCPASSYNCHGYAWYMEFGHANQPVWIETNQISKFWQDQSFYEVFSEPVNVKGIVLYSNNNHSAVTVPGSNPKKYRSKWGWGYLVEHAPNDVPASYGTPSRYFLRCGACVEAPNLLAMTYTLGTVNSVNFVPAGGYSIYTNVPECQLSINQNIAWSTYGGFSNWGTVGQRKLSAWFSLSAGQSVTFSISAPSNCGTLVRSPAFVAQSGYRMYSSNQVKDRLTIEFDNVDYLEILPQTIVISDEKTGLEEKVISIKELFDGKQFDDKKISIDVKKLSRGMKIVNFFYHNLNSKTVQEKLNKQEVNTEFERQSDRVILVD